MGGGGQGFSNDSKKDFEIKHVTMEGEGVQSFVTSLMDDPFSKSIFFNNGTCNQNPSRLCNLHPTFRSLRIYLESVLIPLKKKEKD